MVSSIFPTPFKLTPKELLISSAATIIFKAFSDSGCENISISEICEHPQYGYTASAETIANGPRFVRITDIKGGNINWDTVPFCTCNEPENYILKAGDILVARAGSIGKSFLVSDVPEIAVFASYMIRLRAKNGVLPDYIYCFFQSQQFWLQIASFDRGSAMSNINGKMLSTLVLPKVSPIEQKLISDFLQVFRRRLFGENIELPELPEPMKDVRRTVTRIESLAGRVAEAQSLRREASDETKVLLDTAVGKVFSELRTEEHKSLKELTTKIGSGSTPSGGRSIYQPTGVPFIRSMNVRMRRFQWDDIAYIDRSIHESMAGTWVKPNDVLLNITGASIGRVACAPFDLGEGNVNQHVCIIRPIETVDSKFLMYWLSQPVIQDFINDEQKGATRQGFTKAQIERFEIPLIPLEEQRQLVVYLDGLQAQVSVLREAQSTTERELSALMPSILDRAFKGEL